LDVFFEKLMYLINMYGLSPTQEKSLRYILKCVQAGRSPTLRELCDYMQYKAIGSGQDLVAALRKKGMLEEIAFKSRSLLPTKQAYEFFRESSPLDTISIPCLGAVPAGHPREAVEQRVGSLVFAFESLARPRPNIDQLFALRAKGDSMIHAGILDGDWLVVKYGTEAQHQQIVVARVDGEVTCKRLIRDAKKGWLLRAENPNYKDIRSDSLEIVGSVIALQRSIEG
jgi:repressor LexA